MAKEPSVKVFPKSKKYFENFNRIFDKKEKELRGESDIAMFDVACKRQRPCTRREDCSGIQTLTPMLDSKTLKLDGDWWRCNKCLFEEKNS